jgi:hypothetical protein
LRLFVCRNQLLEERDALLGIAEGPAANGGNRRRVVALQPWFDSKFQADTGI